MMAKLVGVGSGSDMEKLAEEDKWDISITIYLLCFYIILLYLQ